LHQTTQYQIVRLRGFAFDLLLRVVSCWFWARQVLLLFYRIEVPSLVEEVKRLTL